MSDMNKALADTLLFLKTLVEEIRAWDQFTLTISKPDHPYTVMVVRWRAVKNKQLYGGRWDASSLDLDAEKLAFHLLRLVEEAKIERGKLK